MKKLTLIGSSVILSLCLSACGGGGSSTPEETIGSEITPTTETTIDEQFGLYLTDLANNHIVPSYESFQSESQAFVTASTNFCALTNATDTDLDNVKSAWLNSSLSWQKIQWVKVGPVVDVLFRIQFWPDTNTAVSRGVEANLLEQETITPILLSTKQVGGQGLPAAEYLLYPSDESNSLLNSPTKEKRCELLIAISQNITNIATDIVDEWSPAGGNYIDNLVSGTGEFTGKTDAVEELITNWLEQVEKVKDDKILNPLGDDIPGLPATTEHYLSDKSLAAIKANLAVFNDIYTAGQGHGLDDILTDFSEQELIAQIMLENIEAAQVAINLLEGSYNDALSDADKRILLNDTVDKIREVRDLLSTELVQVLSINIGFNSNDGD